MAQREDVTTVGPVLHYPGVHAALGNWASKESSQIDPRISWQLFEGEITREEAQRWSDEQPHAVSLRAFAGRIDNGESVFVSPDRAIGLLPPDLVPQWLKDFGLRGGEDVRGQFVRPAVAIAADDTVRPAPFGTQAEW